MRSGSTILKRSIATTRTCPASLQLRRSSSVFWSRPPRPALGPGIQLLGSKGSSAMVPSAQACRPEFSPGLLQSREASGLSWGFEGGHGPRGDLKVTYAVDHQGVARARVFIF